MKPRQKFIHPYLKELGREIKILRIQQGLSLGALGASIGIDASNMQKIERGMNITISSLVRILIILRKNPSQFFSGLSWDLTVEDIEAFTTDKKTSSKRKRKKSTTLRN